MECAGLVQCVEAYCASLLRSSSALTSMSELLKSTMTTLKSVSPVSCWIWKGREQCDRSPKTCVFVRVCVCACMIQYSLTSSMLRMKCLTHIPRFLAEEVEIMTFST